MGILYNRYIPEYVPPVRYGVKFKRTGLTSDTQLIYVFDAVGMTSATLSTSGFSWGSWENTALGKSFYPAVTTNRNLVTAIDYKLDPNDYTKKTDGTASNITSPSGNVVSVFEGGWISVYDQQEGNTYYTYVVWSNIQYDSSYQAFHRLQAGNVLHNGFTVGCYLSSNTSLTATNSLSGSTISTVKNPSINVQTNTLITHYQLEYIHYLIMIMFCTIDFHHYSYCYDSQGSQNTAGLFNITNPDNVYDTKLFGIENLPTQRNATLMKGLRLSVPRISSSQTIAQPTCMIYDFSTNSWANFLQVYYSLYKEAAIIGGYFSNNYTPTLNPNAQGQWYSAVDSSSYGIIPNLFTRTSNANDELALQLRIMPSTSAAVTNYISSFNKFTYISVNSHPGVNYYLRYASFID